MRTGLDVKRVLYRVQTVLATITGQSIVIEYTDFEFKNLVSNFLIVRLLYVELATLPNTDHHFRS